MRANQLVASLLVSILQNVTSLTYYCQSSPEYQQTKQSWARDNIFATILHFVVLSHNRCREAKKLWRGQLCKKEPLRRILGRGRSLWIGPSQRCSVKCKYSPLLTSLHILICMWGEKEIYSSHLDLFAGWTVGRLAGLAAGLVSWCQHNHWQHFYSLSHHPSMSSILHCWVRRSFCETKC